MNSTELVVLANADYSQVAFKKTEATTMVEVNARALAH
jgi:hypothetical protein